MALAAEPIIDLGLLEKVKEFRHDLHTHPELMFQEKRTAAKVSEWLTGLGVQHKTGLAGGTGVLAYLPATQSPETAKTYALRADMDALPIQEETGKPYASQTPGVMHACGHDGHTSVLAGTVAHLAGLSHRPNNLFFIFQPAEEGGAGGKMMVEDGVLDGKLFGKKVDQIFGLHCFSFLEVGQVATCDGPMMASASTFKIVVFGRGGHAASPHLACDPVVASSALIMALQTIASRGIDPLESVVVSVPVIHGGSAHNVIPEKVEMMGTLRTLSMAVRDKATRRIAEICSNIAEAYECEAELTWEGVPYPVTINDAGAANEFRQAIRAAAGKPGSRLHLSPDVVPVMGGEDFSFYGHAGVPACFFWLGQIPKGENHFPNVHTPTFNFNDDSLAVGIEAMTALALS